MTTAEVSAQTGVTLRQLQWWDEKDLVSPGIDGHGDRDYSLANLRSVRILADLRARGVSLQQSRWIFRCIKPYSVGIAVISMGKRKCYIVPRNQALDWILNSNEAVIVIGIPEI